MLQDKQTDKTQHVIQPPNMGQQAESSNKNLKYLQLLCATVNVCHQSMQDYILSTNKMKRNVALLQHMQLD